MHKQRITVVPYSPKWAKDFILLKDVYLHHLSGFIKSIEHVGSTAIPGLVAKPILDIDIIISSDAPLNGIIQKLSELGYKHVGDRGIKGREAFDRLDETVPYSGQGTAWPDHNLYVCREDSLSLKNHLLLRDTLLTDAEARQGYSTLKYTLISKDPYNINAYVEGKTEFITNILRKRGMDEAHLTEITHQNKAGNNGTGNIGNYKIEPAQPADFPEITDVWEASVRATHHFLKEEDIQYFRPLILNEYLKAVELYCVRDGSAIIGFIGLTPGTIEMLFIHPHYRGKGIGKQLITLAMQRGAKRVDVNEQNLQAIDFYQQMGFRVIRRSPVDSLGKPYPILHMELEINNAV
jgi:putative acetyltransferase